MVVKCWSHATNRGYRRFQLFDFEQGRDLETGSALALFWPFPPARLSLTLFVVNGFRPVKVNSFAGRPEKGETRP